MKRYGFDCPKMKGKIGHKKFGRAFVLLACVLTGYAQEVDLRPFEIPLEQDRDKLIPWMVGNIFSASGFVVPAGHFKIQPTLLTRSSQSSYNNAWNSVDATQLLNISSSILFKFGITSFMDGFVRFESTYNQTSGASTFGFDDLVAGLDVQLYRYPIDSWLPAVKLTVTQFFPTGSYQRLNPAKKRTDAIGTGSFASEIGLAASHIYRLRGIHYLDLRFYTRYRFSFPVSVHGFNTYGGSYDTNGTVFPGQLFVLGSGLQLSLSQRWTLAFDTRYEQSLKRRFSGIAGTGEQMTKPASDRLILAPQLEYSWSPDMGLVAGSWFTVRGRNTRAFSGASAQFTYYY